MYACACKNTYRVVCACTCVLCMCIYIYMFIHIYTYVQRVCACTFMRTYQGVCASLCEGKKLKPTGTLESMPPWKACHCGKHATMESMPLWKACHCGKHATKRFRPSGCTEPPHWPQDKTWQCHELMVPRQ